MLKNYTDFINRGKQKSNLLLLPIYLSKLLRGDTELPIHTVKLNIFKDLLNVPFRIITN
jgi:hypothetical protein